MNKMLIIFFMFSSIAIRADEIVFFKDKNKQVFDFNSQKHLIVSKNCIDCLAMQSLKKVKKINISNGGADPGAVICSQQLNAEVVILKNAKNDETGFCMFKDSSMISLSSLTYQSYL